MNLLILKRALDLHLLKSLFCSKTNCDGDALFEECKLSNTTFCLPSTAALGGERLVHSSESKNAVWIIPSCHTPFTRVYDFDFTDSKHKESFNCFQYLFIDLIAWRFDLLESRKHRSPVGYVSSCTSSPHTGCCNPQPKHLDDKQSFSSSKTSSEFSSGLFELTVSTSNSLLLASIFLSDN